MAEERILKFYKNVRKISKKIVKNSSIPLDKWQEIWYKYIEPYGKCGENLYHMIIGGTL